MNINLCINIEHNDKLLENFHSIVAMLWPADFENQNSFHWAKPIAIRGLETGCEIYPFFSFSWCSFRIFDWFVIIHIHTNTQHTQFLLAVKQLSSHWMLRNSIRKTKSIRSRLYKYTHIWTLYTPNLGAREQKIEKIYSVTFFFPYKSNFKWEFRGQLFVSKFVFSLLLFGLRPYMFNVLIYIYVMCVHDHQFFR